LQVPSCPQHAFIEPSTDLLVPEPLKKRQKLAGLAAQGHGQVPWPVELLPLAVLSEAAQLGRQRLDTHGASLARSILALMDAFLFMR
jgi:hypothetical protein